MPFAAKLHAAVRTDVLDHAQRAVGATHQNHRTFTDHRAFEITGQRHFGLEPDVVPVAPVEETLQLFFVQRRVGIRHERDAAGAIGFPGHLLGEGRAHRVSLLFFIVWPGQRHTMFGALTKSVNDMASMHGITEINTGAH